MALSIKARLIKARATLDAQQTAVFNVAAPRNDVVFSDCLAMAAPEIRAAYDSAYSAVIALECDAVAAGKAWRGTFGHIQFYR